MSGPYDPAREAEYKAYTEHLSTCDDCENGEPVPPDEDYICPEGLRLKAAWLDAELMRRRTPWDRIVRAAEAGRGLRLTAEDVGRLVMDGAIETRGVLDGDCFAKGHDPEQTCEECEREVVG